MNDAATVIIALTVRDRSSLTMIVKCLTLFPSTLQTSDGVR